MTIYTNLNHTKCYLKHTQMHQEQPEALSTRCVAPPYSRRHRRFFSNRRGLSSELARNLARRTKHAIQSRTASQKTRKLRNRKAVRRVSRAQPSTLAPFHGLSSSQETSIGIPRGSAPNKALLMQSHCMKVHYHELIRPHSLRGGYFDCIFVARWAVGHAFDWGQTEGAGKKPYTQTSWREC